MPSMSTVVLAGHLGRDAEIKQVGDYRVCEFSVAVGKKLRGEESTAWYRCQLWGQRGEALAPHLTKGTAVIVSGELIPREYRNKQDELRTSLDVRVGDLTFAGGGREQSAPRDTYAPGPSHDDDIPF